jgi:transcriptional regulator with XRE-family HTH domain
MNKQDAILAIEVRAYEARIPMYKLCERAGVAASTVTRWKSGPNPSVPSLTTIGKLETALDAIEQEKRA